MIEYSWSITQLERNLPVGEVIVAHWYVSAVEDKYGASAYGSTNLIADPSDENYIPYDDLTEADVLTWVWGLINKDEIEANLAAQIESQKTPTTATGIPWG